MREKKDVLFLCQYFYPEYISSATLPYDTAKALVDAGFSVSALCGYPYEYNNKESVPTQEIYKGIEIQRLKYLQMKRSNFIGRLTNYFSFTFSVFLKFFHLRKYKTIIVYSNPPILPLIAAWASKLFKSKMIFVSYDVYPEMPEITKSIAENGIISKLMQFVNKRIYENVDKVVALSTEMKEYLLTHRDKLRDEQVVIIPNWYDDKPLDKNKSPFSNDNFKQYSSSNDFIISYFGNMGIAQDLNTIVEAIRSLKDDNEIKFIFAGHGNKMQKLKDLVNKENLTNVNFYDFLHGKDFQDALNISDCFLVSLTDGLTGLAVPSKTYTYMMAEKPIIAIMGADSDISRDLVENNAGYALEVGETSKLINAIIELRDSRQLKKEMGKNSRSIFTGKYTKEKNTQKYVEILNDILGGEIDV